MISVVLMGVENSGNIGAVARAMKNFGINELILIEPKAEHLSDEAIRRAKHGKDVLEKAKIKKIGFLKNFDYVIGTTSKLGTDYNIQRTALMPWEVSEKINMAEKSLKIAVVFGRESIGLTNKEIRHCDFIATIPCVKEYSALNLSHAVAIMLYEITKNYKLKGQRKEDVEYATAKEKGLVMKEINGILNNVKFSTKYKKETQEKVWKRIFSKSMMTKREAFAVIGLLKKIKEQCFKQKI